MVGLYDCQSFATNISEENLMRDAAHGELLLSQGSQNEIASNQRSLV